MSLKLEHGEFLTHHKKYRTDCVFKIKAYICPVIQITNIERTAKYMKIRFYISYIILVCFGVTLSMAQTNKVYTPMIHTLQTIVDEDWTHPAVIELGSDDFVTVSFDHFSHDYHRFVSHLMHCNADWTPSELFEVDYMDGFNDRPIEWYMNSLNTTFLYTHYAFDYPNEDVQIKLSGNYKVIIYDEESDAKKTPGQPEYKGHPIMAEACFRVVEPLVQVTTEITSNTDIDTHDAHQQLSFVIHHTNYAIDRPDTELKVFVDQNDRPDMTVKNVQPAYINPGRLEYVHKRDLIFPGNNEYRRFEVINMHYGSQNVDDISYFEPYYHARLIEDDIRRAYSFDADHNGRFLVRYDLAEDQDTEADYLFAHFTLHVPTPLQGGRLYVAGKFSDYHYSPEYQMEYNPQTSCYEAAILLKMGAYDYQYVFVPDQPNGKSPFAAPFDGCFYETENEYTISVYHRPFGERYDKLIAVERINFAQE